MQLKPNNNYFNDFKKWCKIIIIRIFLGSFSINLFLYTRINYIEVGCEVTRRTAATYLNQLVDVELLE